MVGYLGFGRPWAAKFMVRGLLLAIARFLCSS
jgi:hypothetical protein